jgi:hypothetical protein
MVTDVESLAAVISTSSITAQSSNVREFALRDFDKRNHRGRRACRDAGLAVEPVETPAREKRTGRRNASRREAALGGE